MESELLNSYQIPFLMCTQAIFNKFTQIPDHVNTDENSVLSSVTILLILSFCEKQHLKEHVNEHRDKSRSITHPRGFGLCVSKECNWQRLFFLLFGIASITSFNFALLKKIE